MRIVGLDEAEGAALLEELMAHATRPEFVYTHRWKQGELVMWDNRCTMHKATGYDAARERRVMNRTVVKGDIPA
jgi:alpha-ketoglutarate-dependent taurine dioxygenase